MTSEVFQTGRESAHCAA